MIKNFLHFQTERHCQQKLQDVIDKLEQIQAYNKSWKECVSAFRSTLLKITNEIRTI